jgi:hypothetical protein
MRKRILITMMLLLVMATGVSASIGGDSFICELKSGATVTWLLTEEPKVELKNGQFVISSTRATVYYDAEDIMKFVLKKDETGIIDVRQSGSEKKAGTVK